jgi:hypothetical protein
VQTVPAEKTALHEHRAGAQDEQASGSEKGEGKTVEG